MDTSQSIFKRNLEALRELLSDKGVRIGSDGWLCYEGVSVIPDEEEYLKQIYGADERLLTPEELEAIWENFVEIARKQTFKANLSAWLQFLDHNGLPVVDEYEWVSYLDNRPPKSPKEYLSGLDEASERLLSESEMKALLKDILNN